MVAQGVEYHEAFDRAMKIFLAGVESRHWIQEGYADLSCGSGVVTPVSTQNIRGGMRSSEIFLAGNTIFPQYVAPILIERPCDCSWQGSPRGGAGGYDPIIRKHKPYILESFYYADADTERLLPYYGDFLLDSGAFTFMVGSGWKMDFEEYLERYADFIKRNKIQKYFELDIDTVAGYEKVKQLRQKLERLTGTQCIPVWHKIRGIEEYKRHCEEYPYVAIGGYVTKEIKPTEYTAFPAMINYAHKNQAKVHCLGFTKLSDLEKYHFDSVDSTAWTTGNRFGYLYYFDGKTMKKKEAPKGHRISDSRAAALNNYTEWIKYQKWANTNL